MTLAHKGLALCESRQWSDAVDSLNKAFEASGNKTTPSPAWLLARSNAYSQLGDYANALRDAEIAYHSAIQRSSGDSRKHMIEAQHRRAIAYLRLNRHANADLCLKWAMGLAEGQPAGKLQPRAEDVVDAEGNYVFNPDEVSQALKPSGGAASRADAALSAVNNSSAKGDAQKARDRALALRSVVQAQLQKMPKDDKAWKVDVSTIPPRPKTMDPTVKVSGNGPSGADEAKVKQDKQGAKAEQPTSSPTPVSDSSPAPANKVAEPEKKAAEPAKEAAQPTKKTAENVRPPAPVAKTVDSKAPSYPTSSKKGPKNWDQIADEADNDEEAGASVDHFFQKLYRDATPEQQRAMMKSFMESNGTTLSTDWNDVGKRTVPTVPPEGVEEKKWGQ